MTKQKWIVTGVTIPVILALVGLGFQPMSINPPFTVPPWLPVPFFVLSGLITVALLSYLMWDAIIRLRVQSPIIIINQYDKKNIVSNTTTIKQSIPTRMTYDNVLWEDAGSDGWGGISVRGPFCPKDFTTLARKRGYDQEVDTHLSDDDYFSDDRDHLFCLECKAEYGLSNKLKSLRQSRSEVQNLFEGIRRRKQQQSGD